MSSLIQWDRKGAGALGPLLPLISPRESGVPTVTPKVPSLFTTPLNLAESSATAARICSAAVARLSFVTIVWPQVVFLTKRDGAVHQRFVFLLVAGVVGQEAAVFLRQASVTFMHDA